MSFDTQIALVVGSTLGSYAFTWACFLLVMRRIDSRRDEVNSRMEKQSTELFEYKVFVANQFSTTQTVNNLKTELWQRLDKINDKLDKMQEGDSAQRR